MALAQAGVGWAIGVAAPGSDRRLRIFCAAAALLPELDLLFGKGPFAHNLFAGILCIAAAAWFFRRDADRAWLAGFSLVGLSFAVHLLMDLFLWGNELRLFWPLSDRGRQFAALIHPSNPVRYVIAIVFLLLPWALAFWKQATPLEILSPRLDSYFLNLFRWKKYDCLICGKKGNNRCGICARSVCLRHGKIGWGFRITCPSCAGGHAPKRVAEGVEDYLALQLQFLRGKEAIRLDPEFASFLHRKLTEGLRRLDDMPRDHPIWQGSDGRPTLAKLVDLSRAVLKDAPDDEESRWVLYAHRVLTNSPDLEYATIVPLILRDFASIRWMVSGARWSYVFSGVNPVIALRPPLESLGKTVGPLEPFLQVLKDDPNPATREAAAKCLELLQGKNPFKT